MWKSHTPHQHHFGTNEVWRAALRARNSGVERQAKIGQFHDTFLTHQNVSPFYVWGLGVKLENL